jgi:RNA polymerase sigma-70 factor (ECF subfamily)
MMIARTLSASSQERFRRLFESHYRAVLAYARRRCATVEDAQDVAAETFAVAWRRMDDVVDADEALPWLYAIAGHVVANQRRTGRRFAAARARLWRQPRSAETASTGEWRSVLDALHRLHTADQEILRLAAWEGLTYRDIASVLHCSENAVGLRLHRARKRLAIELDKTITASPEKAR